MHSAGTGKSDCKNESSKFGSHSGEHRQPAGLQSTHFGGMNRACTDCPISGLDCRPSVKHAVAATPRLSAGFACASICRDARDASGMPQMGGRRFRRGFCPDETVRGQSDSRRVSQACFQNTADKARDVRVVDVRSGAFRFSLVAGAETGLIRVRQGGGLAAFRQPM